MNIQNNSFPYQTKALMGSAATTYYGYSYGDTKRISDLSDVQDPRPSDLFIVSRCNDAGDYTDSTRVSCQVVSEYVSTITQQNMLSDEVFLSSLSVIVRDGILSDSGYLSSLSASMKTWLLNDSDFIQELKKRITGTILFNSSYPQDSN